MFIILYSVTALLLLASLLANRVRTLKALRIALKRFARIAPPFMLMLVAIAVILTLVPQSMMERVLGEDNVWLGLAGAVPLGSVSVMPGFIAFPLCGILLSRGASYMVLSGFSSALMMVGVATFPLEKRYLGTRLALLRNIASLAISVMVAVATGIAFGEIL